MNKEKRIREFLQQRFRNYSDNIDKNDSLQKVVDSLGLFDLVMFVETEFSISIPGTEFSPQRFSTIQQIVEVVREFEK